MGMGLTPFVLVVVFQIYVANFKFCDVNAERQTAVLGDAQAPCSLTVSRQQVHLPRWWRAQFLGVLHVIEECQHFAELGHRIGRNAFRAVFGVEPLEAFVGKVPYFHLTDCSLLLNTLQWDNVPCDGNRGGCPTIDTLSRIGSWFDFPRESLS
jgi:hypothetical protein